MVLPITGYTQLAGVIANPIKHSFSPSIHNKGFQELGIDAVYLAFEVSEVEFPQAIASIKALNMLGVNLSMPYKHLAMDYMDELSPAGKLIGAINTIMNKNGRLIGHNTDGIGFMRALSEVSCSPIGKKITIIGGGGAAVAIIAQAALDGVAEISVFNRPSVHFLEIQRKLKEISDFTKVPIQLYNLENNKELNQQISESLLLVNATSVGMENSINQSPIQDFSSITKEHTVVDVIYNPRETLFLKEAKKRGATTANGFGMLLYQAAAAFEEWTGKELPIAEVKKIME
ncbi:MAG: shikimate dehydrogenase [Lactobacillales bacterium]|nr:shikimate dehydrogenase [Lactobacillales bacterium]